MQNSGRFILTVTVLSVAFVLVTLSSPVIAQDTVEVGVTKAMKDVINAIEPTGGTLPLNAGEMSARYTNVSNDTRYSSDAAISESVDTGWDMTNITDTTTVDGAGNVTVFGDTETLRAGDSVVRAVEVVNLGNNYASIDFSALHLIDTGSTLVSNGNDTFSLELFYENGSFTASQFDTTTMARVGGSDGSVPGWTMGEVKTIFLVVTARAHGSEGDEVKSKFEITNNAPVRSPSTTGDDWERGAPVGGDDTFDTQSGVFWTKVAGPVINLAKSQTVNDSRPGGTIDYTITVTNTGSDTAYDLNVVDAIPDFASYVSGSYVAGTSDTVWVETNVGGENWTEISNYTGAASDVAKIRWAYDQFAYDDATDPSDSIGFSVRID